MPTNPKSIILEDLQSLENYMYNVNGTHLLDLQPPPQLDPLEQEKWVKKHTRYRQRKNNGMANGCGIPNYGAVDCTSEAEDMHQQQQHIFNKTCEVCTSQSGQTTYKNLQGKQNLLQCHSKRKTPLLDSSAIKSNKKEG